MLENFDYQAIAVAIAENDLIQLSSHPAQNGTSSSPTP